MEKSQLKRSLAIRFLTLAVIATQLFIIALGIYAYHSSRRSQVSKKTDLRILELRGKIMQLDEVLTMSARMAAVTGNMRWEERYKTFEPELDSAIKEAIGFSPEAYSGEAAKKTDEANIKLVEMERRSFDLVRSGKATEALAVLFSPGYEQYKKVYAEGMDQFAKQLKQGVEAEERNESRMLAIDILIRVIVIILLAIGWVFVLKAVRGWEYELIEINQKLREATEQLNDFNKTLDEKVKQRTRELEESEKMLVQTEKMAAVGQLAAGIAHEVNNPVGVILGYAEALARTTDAGDQRQEYIKSIEHEAMRCKRIIQDLLSFSRVDKHEKAMIDVNDAIEGALSLVLAQSKAKHIEFVKDFNPDLPGVNANANQVQQIVVNLASNAIDAMPKSGKLTIRTRRTTEDEKSWVQIEVSDTGSGIPPDIQSKVFEPFFTTKGAGKGTGLGLALVYEIVQRHAGRIKFETAPLKGTTFSVLFPLL